jgi:hypothetical protein
MKMGQCSEILAFKLQTPLNHAEESIKHSEYGKSLKSRKTLVVYSPDINIYYVCGKRF